MSCHAQLDVRGNSTSSSTVELLVLLVAAPAFLFPEELPRVLTAIGLGIGLIAWVTARLAGPTARWQNPLNLPSLLLLVMVFPSLYASADPWQSLPKLTGLAFGFLVFSTIVAHLKSRPEQLSPYIKAFAVGGIGLTGIGLVGTAWSSKFQPLETIYARLPRLIHSVPNYIPNEGIHPNELAGTMLFFIPLMLALTTISFARPWNAKEKWTRLLWLGASVIAVSTLVLTQSRSAIFGLTFAALIWAAWSSRWFRPLSAALVLGSGALLWFDAPTQILGERLFGTADSGPILGSLSFAGRLEAWQRSIYMLQDFAYSGVGLNMFGRVADVLYPFFVIRPEQLVPHAHNILLQVGVELGIPGLVAYVGLITAFFLRTAGTMRKAALPKDRWMAMGLCFGMVAHQSYGLTDAVALGARPNFVFWIVLALATSLCGAPRGCPAGDSFVAKEAFHATLLQIPFELGSPRP